MEAHVDHFKLTCTSNIGVTGTRNKEEIVYSSTAPKSKPRGIMACKGIKHTDISNTTNQDM